MKQVLQDLSKGSTYIEELPVPDVRRGELLIRNRRSLISAGTERMLMEFGQAGLLGKVKQQPDKVRMVLEKVRTDGLLTTIDAVTSKLNMPVPLGYSSVGTVVAVGDGVSGFKVGDRVVSNGPHAEYSSVPRNLCARVPDTVSDDDAAFTVVAAIGLQGVRLAMPTLGESFVVIGLGLIGLLTVQILRAHGCRVIGLDFDPVKVELAQQMGASAIVVSEDSDPVSEVVAFSGKEGVDGVIITAATASSTPVSQASRMCRKRGRIILVGVAGLNLSRADFYEKELSFQVSCSYGPGRYDDEYEQKGRDYPLGFVRWTEQRNFEAILQLMADETLVPGRLITSRFSIEQAESAYEQLAANSGSLAILLEYESDDEQGPEKTVVLDSRREAAPAAGVSVIGAGNYSGRVLCPTLAKLGAELRTMVTTGSASGGHYARKFGFDKLSTDAAVVFDDASTNSVVVATRHDSHAEYVIRALRSGLNIYVEKPLCLTMQELADIESEAKRSESRLLVGFNRRFSPLTVSLKSYLDRVSAPKALTMTVNAGAIPGDHWALDPQVGGGRLIGEACHFIDLLRFLSGSPIVASTVESLTDKSLGAREPDSFVITLKMQDGSVGSIQYFANGSKQYSKERLDVFAGGSNVQIDNWRKLRSWNSPGLSSTSLIKQDKGQVAIMKAFLEAVREGRASPIPVDELIEVARVSIELAESIR